MTLDELEEADPRLTAVVALGLWEGEVDSDNMPCIFRNHYFCEDCGDSWTMEWSCACDDDCPSCSGTYSPLDTEEWDFEKDDWGSEE